MNRPGLGRGRRVQIGGRLGRHLDRRRRIELELAPRLTHADVVYLEVDQMAAAITHIRPPLLDPLTPGVEIELAVGQFDVNAAETDAFAVNAREVGLAGNLAPVSAVKRVIPDVELPWRRGVDGRDEIDGVVHHVDDILVGADAVKGRDLIRRQLVVSAASAPIPSVKTRQLPLATCPT